MEEDRIPQKLLGMNLEKTRLRGRPRNRWQDEVREHGRPVGGKVWNERVYNRGIEEAPENGKESSHPAHVNGMNETDFRPLSYNRPSFTSRRSTLAATYLGGRTSGYFLPAFQSTKRSPFSSNFSLTHSPSAFPLPFRESYIQGESLKPNEF
jgi:hypothetical protein